MSKKILIVGPAWVGDMVMAQCLFKLLKREQDAIIDVLAPAWSLPLLSRMPEVNAGIAMPVGHGELALIKRYSLAKKLRQQTYDQAIVLPNSFKSALIPWLAGIPVRTGWRGEVRYGLLNDLRILDKKRYPLMIERFMALALKPHETIPADYAYPQLNAFPNVQVASILAICPGAEFGPAKRWPEEHYAELAKAKLAVGWQVWILGSPNDSLVAAKIMQLTEHQCIDFTGKTSLVEAIDLLASATVVVCNDSGLMHIAAALNKPLIALYGPTTEIFTPPLSANAQTLSLTLDCQPCHQRICPLKHHRCMKELKPENVLALLS